MSKAGKKRITATIIIIVTFIIISLLILYINQAPKLLTFDKTIQEIRYDGTTAYIHLSNDSTDYVFYEFIDTSVDCLSRLKPGDKVSVTVATNYEKFKYAIVYTMSANGETLFDSLEYYRQHDTNVSIVFMTIISAILLTILLIILTNKEKTPTKADEFHIKGPEWLRNIFLITTVAGFSGFLPFWIMFWLGTMAYKTALYSFSFLVFLVLGFLGLYCYFRESFILSNGIYTLRTPFKTQSAAIQSIGLVEILTEKDNPLITFWSKDHVKLLELHIHTYFDCTDELIASLVYHKIPIKSDLPTLLM